MKSPRHLTVQITLLLAGRFLAGSRFALLSITLIFLGVSAGTVCAEPQLRQSFEMRVPVPPTPVTVMGNSELVYELHLTNFAPTDLIPERVEVSDADAGSVLADFGATELERRLYRPGAASAAAGADARLIDAGRLGVVYLELTIEASTMPRALEHRVTFRSDGDAQESTVIQGARISVGMEPPAVLAPPLRGGPWVAIHDPFWPRGHRRFIYAVDGEATIPGRYAIDWIRVDDSGRYARGNEDAVDNWLGYGADVLAVADGTVVAARDDVAESALISEHPDHPLEDATGNYVAIDIGDGRVAFFEHLKPGSVRVRNGDRVRQGQVIGALGFTGQSTGPHLHFHLADRNSPLGAEGMPFVLDGYELLGRYPDFDRFGDARWTPLPGAMDQRRRGERPPPNSVVEFR